jgi:hypothetical protein
MCLSRTMIAPPAWTTSTGRRMARRGRMAKTLVLIPAETLCSARACAREIGSEDGLQDIITIDGQVIVTKKRPRGGGRVRFKVWQVESVTPFTWDGREQQKVQVQLLAAFDKSS